jgi:nucleoside-diphosphate-sugar epimerase
MKWAITGGAGFIGINASHRLWREGHQVVLLDSFSRAGVVRNLDWLKRQGRFEVDEIVCLAASR